LQTTTIITAANEIHISVRSDVQCNYQHDVAAVSGCVVRYPEPTHAFAI
jgi:hypothetical protein